MGVPFIDIHVQRIKNFLGFAQNYVVKNNPIVAIASSFEATIRDFLTFGKKIKMAKYRVNYQQYKFNQMQELIAQNNEHVFLKGRTLNEIR